MACLKLKQTLTECSDHLSVVPVVLRLELSRILKLFELFFSIKNKLHQSDIP